MTTTSSNKPSPKKLSNPISTGGVGPAYESKVQATYLLALLTGDPVAIAPEAVLTGLQFQSKIHGHHTDDLVCTAVDQAGKPLKVLIQIKKTVKAALSNSAFTESIVGAWMDFKNPETFNVQRDRLVLVFDADTESAMRGPNAIAEFARSSWTADEFVLKATASGFASAPTRNALTVISAVVTDIVSGPVHIEELRQFVARLWFIAHNLSSENTAEYAHLLGRIRHAVGQEAGASSSAVWAELVLACSRMNAVSASISLVNLEGHVPSALLNAFETYRTKERTGMAVDVAAAIRGLGADKLMAAILQNGQFPPDGLLASSRPNSSNKVISNQLDAIDEKIRAYRDREALEDLDALGRDLGPFDQHQKARWYLQRGACNWHMGDAQEAATNFLKAASLSDDDEKMVAARIRGHILKDELPVARDAAEQASERFPKSQVIWLARAEVLIKQGVSVTLDDVPPILQDEPDVLQLLAAGFRCRGDIASAFDLTLKSLAVESANFYTRHAALALAVEQASIAGGYQAYSLPDCEIKQVLSTVVSAFAPRNEKLWSIQAPKVLTKATEHLGHAFLFLERPQDTLQLIQEAKVHGISSTPLVRLELDALYRAGRLDEMLSQGDKSLQLLDEDGLINLAQAAADGGDVSLSEKILATAALTEPAQLDTLDILQSFRWVSMWNSPQRDKVVVEVLDLRIEDCESLPLIFAGARILLWTNKLELAEAAVCQAQKLVAASGTAHNKLLLAELLFDAKNFEEAGQLYAGVLSVGGYSPYHLRYFQCLVCDGKRRKAKELLDGFPAEWALDNNSRNAAITLAQRSGDWALLDSLVDIQLNNTPLDAKSWVLKIAASESMQKDPGLSSLLEAAPSVLVGSIQDVATFARIEIQHGRFEQGVTRLYRLRRTSPDTTQSAEALVLNYFMIPNGHPWMSGTPTFVAANCSVTLEDSTGRQHVLTIDPEGLSGLPETAEFKESGSAEAMKFLGMTVGQSVTLHGPFGTSRELTVRSITTAFERILQCALEALGNPFSPAPNALLFNIPSNDGVADLSALKPPLAQSRQRADDALAWYSDAPVTLGLVSERMGMSPVNLVRAWPLEGTPLYISTGLGEEKEEAFELMQARTCSFVADAATIMEVVTLGCTQALKAIRGIFVSAHTRDIIRTELADARRLNVVGMATESGGMPQFMRVGERSSDRNIRQLEEALRIIDENCTVLPAYGPVKDHQGVWGLQNVLSPEEQSVILLAVEKEACLFSIDSRFRWWASSVGIAGIWPQILLIYAEQKQLISSRCIAFASAKMFLTNRSFVALRPDDLISMIHQGPEWANAGLDRFTRYLQSAETDFGSALTVALEFLRRLSTLNVTVGAYGEILRSVVAGVVRHSDFSADALRRIEQVIFSCFGNVGSGAQPVIGAEPIGQATCRYLLARAQESLDLQSAEDLGLRPTISVLFCTKTPAIVVRKAGAAIAESDNRKPMSAPTGDGPSRPLALCESRVLLMSQPTSNSLEFSGGVVVR